MKNKKSVVLIILDGFGLSPITEGNAVYQAKTPFFDSLIRSYPTTTLHASGQEVGLGFGEMGNSEVGHLNLGTGRIVMQDLPRINQAIENQSFFENKELLEVYQFVKKNKSTLHLLGLTSTGGVHSHLDHLFALLDLAKKEKVKQVAIHLITDGRDTPPKKAIEYVKRIEEKIKQLELGKISTVCGRFYAMDRDKHWQDRSQLSYDLLTQGKGQKFDNVEQAIKSGYNQGESDENLTPKVISGINIISKNDAVIFYNFRADRAKQLSQALIDPNFKKFKREKFIQNLLFVSFTNYGYEPTPMVKIAFFSQEIKNPLAEVLARNNLTQLHIAETEKYAHITYFFNGGQEKALSQEEKILVPSPRINSYDKKPEMSTREISKKFLVYFKNKEPSFSIINFANPDMVGHTGNFQAAIKGIETVDGCLKDIIITLKKSAVKFIITADHGNAEQMINPETKDIDKEHTTNPVPFILVDKERKKLSGGYDKISLTTTRPTAVLADVTATVLDLLDLPKPSAITGQSLKDFI